jgi:hypothetical protein
MTLILFLTVGCKVDDKTWIDKMLSEMESAWIEADKAKLGQGGRDTAVTAVAQKYFVPGMAKEEAFKLLLKMNNYGFEIRESRHEGGRIWPSKSFITWGSTTRSDAATIKNLQLSYKKGASYFSAGKMYGRERVIIKKTATFSFKIVDDMGVIDSVEAALYANSI